MGNLSGAPSFTNLRRELKREYSYFSGDIDGTGYEFEPAMFIFKESLLGVSCCIPLPLAWTYNEQQKLSFRETVQTARRIGNMLVHLGYEPNRALIEQMWLFIQDGLDDLMKVPPKSHEYDVVGESVTWVDGRKISNDITVRRES